MTNYDLRLAGSVLLPGAVRKPLAASCETE